MDGRTVLSLSRAVDRLIGAVALVGTEKIPLFNALNRVSAETATAAFDVPGAASSAMDGWAVRAADLAAAGPDAPVELRRIGEVPAGRPFGGVVGTGETVRIFTGGLLPAGADAVEMQEDAAETSVGAVFRRAVAPGRHVRAPGRDFAAGRLLLPAGVRLTAGALGLAAAAGKAEIIVARRPRVGVLAAGDELTMPGRDPGPAGATASNLFAVAGVIEGEGGEAVCLGVASDDPAMLMRRLEAAAAGLDLLVVCGGGGGGAYDVVSRLAECTPGWENLRIAMRPCRGVAVGRIGGAPLLGLPGNPAGAFVGAVMLLAPMVRRMLGNVAPPLTVSVRVDAALPAAGDATAVYFARLRRRGKATVAELSTGKNAGGLSAPAEADALIVAPPHRPASPPGAPAEALLLRV